MYWDQLGLTVVLSIFALIILFILFRFKAVKGKQIPLILIGNIFFFWFFNQVFIFIPIADYTPLTTFDMMTELNISEWEFLSNYDLNYILNDSEWLSWYLHEEWLPTLAMIGVSFFYTLGLKWHRKIKWALVSCLANALVFVLFPLIENRIWGGLVGYVKLPLIYLSVIFYLIGYLLCRLFLFLMKKFRQIKEKEAEMEIETDFEPEPESKSKS